MSAETHIHPAADTNATHPHGDTEGRITCPLCPHVCRLRTGETGFCRARANVDGTIRAVNYGRLTALALDPIEKKPLYHFHPESFILSVGSFGCNLACPFCQNAGIAMADDSTPTEYVAPARLAALADDLRHQPRGNLGVAFTYNEPLVGYEYIMDSAPLLHAAGLSVVLVTNGTISAEPLAQLLPHVDAMNIDLKAWRTDTYRRLGGDFATVKETIARAVRSGVHVEERQHRGYGRGGALACRPLARPSPAHQPLLPAPPHEHAADTDRNDRQTHCHRTAASAACPSRELLSEIRNR